MSLLPRTLADPLEDIAKTALDKDDPHVIVEGCSHAWLNKMAEASHLNSHAIRLRQFENC